MGSKVEDLIKEMTLEEKVSMLAGVDKWCTRGIERLGIPSLKMTDGPHGARTVSDDDPYYTYPATCFPTSSALGATWNPELVNRVGTVIGKETKARGCAIILGPCINIQRSPLGGRNFESYSEDPFLTARMAVAYVNGVQSQDIGVSVKHFALNNSEFERFTISSEADERTIREIYLPAFAAAVKECQPWTVMCAYNRINGVYASENRYFLNDILKTSGILKVLSYRIGVPFTVPYRPLALALIWKCRGRPVSLMKRWWRQSIKVRLALESLTIKSAVSSGLLITREFAIYRWLSLTI